MELWMHSYCNHYLLLTKKDNWNLKFHSISLTFVPSPSLDGIFDGKLANDIRNNIMNFRINDFSAAQRYNFGITCWWVNLTCKINLKFIFLQVSIVGEVLEANFETFHAGMNGNENKTLLIVILFSMNFMCASRLLHHRSNIFNTKLQPPFPPSSKISGLQSISIFRHLSKAILSQSAKGCEW